MSHDRIVLVLLVVMVVLFLLTRRKKVNLEAVLAALQDQSLGVYPNPHASAEDPDFDQNLWLANNCLSLYYQLSDLPERKVETLSIGVSGYEGGIVVTYVNDDIVEWTRNGVHIRQPRLSGPTHVKAHKALEAVRTKIREAGY